MTNRFLWFYNGFLFLLSIFIFLEWLSKPITLLCYMLLLAFLNLTASTFNSIPIILNIVTNRNVALIYSVTICQQKTKDCARSGSFEHNPQHRCFRLWCLRAFITDLLYWLWTQWPALSMIFFLIITCWKRWKGAFLKLSYLHKTKSEHKVTVHVLKNEQVLKFE